MKSYIVRDVAKEIGVSVNTFRYHLSDLQEGVDYTRGDNNNRATITEDALIRIANNGKFKFSSILLRFLELNKECGLDVPNEESNELENCKKALEYLQEKYTQLEEDNNAIKGDVKSVSADYNNLLQECLELQGFKDRYSKEYADMINVRYKKDSEIGFLMAQHKTNSENYQTLLNEHTALKYFNSDLDIALKKIAENNTKLLIALDENQNQMGAISKNNLKFESYVSDKITTLSENSKEFDMKTTILLIWNIVITVLIALSFLK